MLVLSSLSFLGLFLFTDFSSGYESHFPVSCFLVCLTIFDWLFDFVVIIECFVVLRVLCFVLHAVTSGSGWAHETLWSRVAFTPGIVQTYYYGSLWSLHYMPGGITEDSAFSCLLKMFNLKLPVVSCLTF